MIEGVEVSRDVRLLGIEIIFDPLCDMRGRAWLQFDRGLRLAYGRNGVGKSTVIEALRSALSGVGPTSSLSGRVRLYATIGVPTEQFLPAFVQHQAEQILLEQSDAGDVDVDELPDDDPSEETERIAEIHDDSIAWSEVMSNHEHERWLRGGTPRGLVGKIGEADWITESFRGMTIDELHQIQSQFLPPALFATRELLIAETWWPNPPPLPIARALWLTHFVEDASMMWDCVGERPGRNVLLAALRQAALENVYCLEPVGATADQPAWLLSPAVDRQGSDGVADELWRLTEKSFREHLESCRTDGMSTEEIMGRGDETDVLNSMGPSTALVEYDLSGPQVLGIANPSRYLRLKGWRGVATVEPHHLGWTPSIVELAAPIDPDRWLRDALGQVKSAAIRTTDEGVAAEGTGLEDLDEKIERVGRDLLTFDIGLSGVRRTSSSRASDWLVGRSQSLEFCDTSTRTWVVAERLSAAQRLIVGTVLQLSGADGNDLVIGDEVDVGMHVRLIRRYYEYVEAHSSMGLVATHSPVALSMRGPLRLHVKRDVEGRIEIRAWNPSSISEGEADQLGVDRPHLLSALTGLLIVEGHHDRVALEALLAATESDRPPGSLIRVSSATGYDGMPSSVASLLQLDVTDAPVVVVADGGHGLDLREIRDRAAAMEAGGDSALRITAAVKLHQRVSKASREEKALLSVLDHAIQQRTVHRLHVVTFDQPDIIFYARPCDFGVRADDWTELVSEWRSSPKSGQPFKTWLRAAKRADVSTSRVADAFSRLDHYRGNLGEVLAYINDCFSSQ